MAYVVPNNRVVIYKNIPLERNYERSLYFANKTAQDAFFPVTTQGNTKVKYVFNDMTHIRVTTPGRKIRVPININDLYDCNYLGITNYASGGHTTKTFYCFIDNVEYVNENLSEISYSIDVIQTWLFQFITGSTGELKNICFVEREHVKDDTRGINILDENFNTDDMLIGDPEFDPHFNSEMKLVMLATANVSGNVLGAPDGRFINGTFHMLDRKIYSTNPANMLATIDQIKLDLDNLQIFNRTDTIVNFIMVPSDLIGIGTTDIDTSVEDSHLGGRLPIHHSWSPQVYPSQGNYIPFNNKLLTYPYSFFTLDNHEGQIEEFKYELFGADGVQFEMYRDFSPEPTASIVPFGYHRTGISYSLDDPRIYLDMGKSMKFSNFPKCTWASNDLSAKFVQAGIGVAITALTRGLYITNPGMHYEQRLPNIPPIINPMQTDQSKQMQVYQRPFMEIPQLNSFDIPSQKIGVRLKPMGAIVAGALSRAVLNSKMDSFAGNGNINYPMGFLGFEIRPRYLRPEIAKMIDDYFSMYGYKVNALKAPCIKNRQYWTYVKTNGCVIDGEIPNDDAEAISDIFDNGITFWDVNNLPAGHSVGDYNQIANTYVNTPIS